MVSGGASLSRSSASPLRHTSSVSRPWGPTRRFCSSTSPQNTLRPESSTVTHTSSGHCSPGNTASSRSAGASRS